MALQSGHIKWILGELSIRTIPQMSGEQAENMMMAQKIVKQALLAELEAALAREAPPQEVDDGGAVAQEDADEPEGDGA